MDISQSISVGLSRPMLPVSLLLGAILIWSQATARQSTSGAVETFEPEFDVGVEMRPRVGLFGITELMMAALEADIPKAKQILDAGADINERDDSQSTPLMWAVHSGDVEIVRFLIARGADVRAKAYRNATALMVAMTGKHEQSAVALIEAGADANGRGNSAMNYLEDAAMSGMTDVVDALIRNGTDLSTYGGSALHWAVSRGQTDTARRLLDAGVGANATVTRSSTSLVSIAAASGDVALVELLITKGADIGRPGDGSSPLYAAASRGYTEVVKLLIENGETSTADVVLAAIRKGHGETTAALLNSLDLETIEISEAEQLVIAADELGNDAVTTLLLNSKLIRSIIHKEEQAVAAIRRAASREDSRLLSAKQVEDHCVINIWDSRSRISSEVARITECPYELYVSPDNQILFVLDKSSIRIVSIDGSVADREIDLPDLNYHTWLEHMAPRPDQRSDYLPSGARMAPGRISYLADGALALIVNVWMPGDDFYQYLMRFDGGQWSMGDGQWCNRFGCDNALGDLTSKSTRHWPESRRVWHEAQKLNPFMSKLSVEMVDLDYENYKAAIYHREFEVDGVTSTLSAFTRPSEHYDTTYSFGITLTVGESAAKELSENQCLTSIVGRYILIYEYFEGRFEVTDLGTGETLVNDLKTALWLD